LIGRVKKKRGVGKNNWLNKVLLDGKGLLG